jgi:hypothetical protein
VKRGLAAGALTLAALVGACSTDLGDLPARCPDGECPEGYDCINEVCARPGTAVPLTVATLGNLREGDLQIVPQADGVLIAWETYPYSELGQTIFARSLSANGSLGAEVVLDDSWQADPGAVEPFFSVAPTSDGRVLIAISSSPIDDDPRPRIGVFSVAASGGSSEPMWPAEVRMATIGYGNVSQPRFLAKPGGGFELGYFAGVADPLQTIGRLAVFDLEADGSLSSPLTACADGDAACCSAHRCYDSTRTEAIAAGVEQAFRWQDRSVWAIDKTRPSIMVPDETSVDPIADELFFGKLGLPLASDNPGGIAFVAPSARTGDKLPTAPATGAARLALRALDGAESALAELPVVRDAPRAAWAPRDATRGYLVSPGELVDSPVLRILDVDTGSGETVELGSIERISSLEIGSVTAAVVGERLFVVWLETAVERAVIRAAVLPLL